MRCVVSKNDKRDLLSQISLYQYSTIPTAIYCDLLRSYSLECLTMQFVRLSYRIVSRHAPPCSAVWHAGYLLRRNRINQAPALDRSALENSRSVHMLSVTLQPVLLLLVRHAPSLLNICLYIPSGTGRTCSQRPSSSLACSSVASSVSFSHISPPIIS